MVLHDNQEGVYDRMTKADGPGFRFGSSEVSDCAIAGDIILPMNEAGH
jgi:hypothetical protein